jgi:uncharacterized protein
MRYVALTLMVLLWALPAVAEGEFSACHDAYTHQKPEAFELCKPLAEGDSKEAQKMLGDMFYWGWGNNPKQDYEAAMLWYKRAASHGQVEAKYNVGVMYEAGQGVAVNYAYATKWYRSAAEAGYKEAKYNLGNMYAKGAGIRQDDVAASKWFLEAAKVGVTEAQYNIAIRYVKGLGIPTDYVEAYFWFSLAERAGDKDAIKNKNLIRTQMTDEEAATAETRLQSWHSQ